MGIEGFKERPKIQMSKEDFDRLQDFAMEADLNASELQPFLEKHGMSFNQGAVEVTVNDGTRWEVMTDKNDFGTMVPIENGAPRQGYDTHDHRLADDDEHPKPWTNGLVT